MTPREQLEQLEAEHRALKRKFEFVLALMHFVSALGVLWNGLILLCAGVLGEWALAGTQSIPFIGCCCALWWFDRAFRKHKLDELNQPLG